MSSSSEPSSGPPTPAPTGRRDDPSWYTRRVELTLYVLAGASYITLGMFNKWLLNWIIGPIWLVAWIWLAPVLIDRYRARRAA
ncbi:MAG: hypothetical protein ACT452_21725 [Microthrixaceae bacterium]